MVCIGARRRALRFPGRGCAELLAAAGVPFASAHVLTRRARTTPVEASFGTSGWIGCYLDYPLGSSVVANPVWGKPDGKNTAACPSGTYTYNGVADTPAPCWAKTQPNAWGSSTQPTPAVTSTFQGVQVPHFLDFSSILRKDTHNQVFRVPVRPGACLPGNMVNVRTSAASFPALAAAPTNYASSAFMDAKMNVYTTTADDITNGMLTQYTPRSPNNTISIYFGAPLHACSKPRLHAAV